MTTAAASAATAAVAPVGKAAPQALVGAPPNPATGAPTPAPGVPVTPLAKAPMSNAAGVGGGPALAKATTQSATATITPLGKAAAPSAGHVLAPASNAATRALAPTVQGVERLVTPTSGLIHRETSTSEASGNALATVLKAAIGRATGVATPASTAGVNLISAPQGASAALRGAIRGIDGVPWGAVSSALASRLPELLGSLAPRSGLGPPARTGVPGALAQSIPAGAIATPPRAPAGASAGTDGLASPMPAPTPMAALGTLAGAGASGCALSRLQGLLGELCGAGRPPGQSLPSRSSVMLLAAAGSALGTSMVRAASDGSDARADPGSKGVPGAVPIPAPSGASGSAATSGFAVSVFLTLAGLLLLAAPATMRRLRLSREPWLEARFVLIPERPG